MISLLLRALQRCRLQRCLQYAGLAAQLSLSALWAQKGLQTNLSLARRGAPHRSAAIAWGNRVHHHPAPLAGALDLRPSAVWLVAGGIHWAQQPCRAQRARRNAQRGCAWL